MGKGVRQAIGSAQSVVLLNHDTFCGRQTSEAY